MDTGASQQWPLAPQSPYQGAQSYPFPTLASGMALASANVGSRGIPTSCNAQYVTYAVRLYILLAWQVAVNTFVGCEPGRTKHAFVMQGGLTLLSVNSWDSSDAANRTVSDPGKGCAICSRMSEVVFSSLFPWKHVQTLLIPSVLTHIMQPIGSTAKGGTVHLTTYHLAFQGISR